MIKNNYEIFNNNDFLKWEKILNEMKLSAGLRVYKKLQYHNLYAYQDTLVESFVKIDKKKKFFFPYLKKKISIDKFKNYYDIETVYGYGGLVCNSNDIDFIEDCLKEFINYCSNSNVVACLFRFDPFAQLDLNNFKTKIEISFQGKIVYKTFNKNNNILENYSSSIRNKINKALKNKYLVKQSSNYEDYLKFINIYHVHLKNINASNYYYFTKQYFEKIFYLMKDDIDFFCIKNINSNEIYGGAIVIKSEKECSIHLSAIDSNKKNDGISSLLRHEITRFYFDRKYELINYGGGNSVDENDSLFKFKKNFSNQTMDFYIGKLVVNNNIFNEINNYVKENYIIEEKYEKYFLKYRYAK